MKDNYTLELHAVSQRAAREYLDESPFPQQRSLRMHHVEFLARLMHRKQFIQGTQIHFVCLPTGKRYLVNGQHTLQAICLSGCMQTLSILTTDVNSLAEAQQIYRGHDHALHRTVTDLYGVSEIETQLHLGPRQASAAAAAMHILAHGFFPPIRTGFRTLALRDPECRFAMLESWKEELQEYFSTMAGATVLIGNTLLRAPVVAVALVTLRFQPVDARDFWSDVAHGESISPAPSRALHDLLLSRSSKEYRPHIYARLVAVPWNADFNDRPMKSVRGMGRRTPKPQPRFEGLTPITIEGTPHTAAQSLSYITEDWEILHEPCPLVADTKAVA